MNNSLLDFLFSAGLLPGRGPSSDALLSPEEFVKGYEGDPTACLIDVRTPGEYASGHIKGAKLINLYDGKAFADGIAMLDKTRVCYLYCHSGNRSARAAASLRAAGFEVKELRGGMIAWSMAGMPTVKK